MIERERRDVGRRKRELRGKDYEYEVTPKEEREIGMYIGTGGL